MIDISGSTTKVSALKSLGSVESGAQTGSREDFSSIIGGLDSKTRSQVPGEQLPELDAAINSPDIDAGGNTSPPAFLAAESLVIRQASTTGAFESDSDLEEIAALESIVESGLVLASAPPSLNVTSAATLSVPLEAKLSARAPTKVSAPGPLSDQAKVIGEKIEGSADRLSTFSAAIDNEFLSPDRTKSTGLFRDLSTALSNASSGPSSLTDLSKTPILASATDAPEAVSAVGAGSLSEAKSAVLSATTVNPNGQVPLSHPRFAEGFSQQVLLVAKDGAQTARLSINPAELGPVDLRIVMRNDEVTVQLASQHLAVRDALQEALPRLREQFEQAGMHLEDSAVFHDLPNQTHNGGDSEHSSASDSFADQSEPGQQSDAERNTVLTLRRGFVDAYV
ncbi:MAG: flagellar hook-length control protein FliK [Gammaproteobacteria bacterium]|jgi:flagellar hook-length control protein FliK